MEEYLPPVVTKLKADLTDLVTGFAKARALMREWADGVSSDLRSQMKNLGQDLGNGFNLDFRGTLRADIKQTMSDMAEDVAETARDHLQQAGHEGAKAFSSGFSSMAMPLLIAAIVLLSPVLAQIISSAILLGVGGIFIGLGVFLLREQKGLVEAATRFKETLQKVFTVAAMPMLKPLIDALNTLTSGLQKPEVLASINTIFLEMSKTIGPLAAGLSGFLTETVKGMADSAPTMRDLMIALAQNLPRLGEALGNFFRALGEGGPGLVRFINDATTGLAGLIEGTGKVLKTLSDVYLWLAKLHDQSVEDDWDEVNIPYFGPIIVGAKKAWEGAKEAWAGISSAFNSAKGSVSSWAKETWADISAWAGKVGDWFSNLPGKIGDWLSSLPDKIGNAAERAFDRFFYLVGFYLGLAFTAIAMWPGQVLAKLAEFRDNALAWIGGLVIGLMAKWEEFKIWLPVMLGNLFEAMVSWAKRTKDDVVDWFRRTVSDISDWLGKLPETARQKGKDFKDTVVQFFKDASKWLYQAGKDLIAGLVEGIVNAASGAVDAIKRAMDRIKQGAKDALGISSPSKVFAELGEFSMQGFLQGFTSNKDQLSAIWSALAPGSFATPAAAVAGLAPGASAMGSPAGPTMVHATFTIDGHEVVDAIVPAAQDKKRRNGETGLA